GRGGLLLYGMAHLPHAHCRSHSSHDRPAGRIRQGASRASALVGGNVLCDRHHRRFLALRVRSVSVLRQMGDHGQREIAQVVWQSLRGDCAYAHRRWHGHNDSFLPSAVAGWGGKEASRDAETKEGEDAPAMMASSRRRELGNLVIW